MTAVLRTAAEVLENVVGDDAPPEFVQPLRQACAALAPTLEDFAVAHRDLDDEDRPRNDTLYLNADVVRLLLTKRGWTLEGCNGGGTAYVKPGARLRADGGKFGVDYLWERDEALTVALTAEALA